MALDFCFEKVWTLNFMIDHKIWRQHVFLPINQMFDHSLRCCWRQLYHERKATKYLLTRFRIGVIPKKCYKYNINKSMKIHTYEQLTIIASEIVQITIVEDEFNENSSSLIFFKMSCRHCRCLYDSQALHDPRHLITT